MLSGVAKLSNFRCSTVSDNVCWTMLKGYVKLAYICWTRNQIYTVIIFLSFSFGRIAQLVAHSLRKREVPGSNPWHGTWQSFSSFLVYDDIPLACDFYISFHSLSLFFSNWGKLDVSSTFHVNFCSFLIFHELESTDLSTPQQLPARGRPCLQLLEFSYNSSCSFVIGQFPWTSSRTHLLGWKVWQKPKYKFYVIMLITHVSTLLRWDVKWFNFCQPTLLDQQCVSIWPQPYITFLFSEWRVLFWIKHNLT